MSGRAFATVTFLGEDGSHAQTIWALAGEDAGHELRDQLGSLLGEPVAEVVIGVAAAAAMKDAGVAGGGFVVIPGGDAG